MRAFLNISNRRFCSSSVFILFIFVFISSSIFFNSLKRSALVSVFYLNSSSSSFLFYSFAYLSKSLWAINLAFLSSFSFWLGPPLPSSFFSSSYFSVFSLFYFMSSAIERPLSWFSLSCFASASAIISYSSRFCMSIFMVFC